MRVTRRPEMSVARGAEFDDLGKLCRSMERLFEDFLPWRRTHAPTLGEWEPAVEMFETEGEVVVRAGLPSIDPKQVEIVVTDEAVTLRGETKHEEEEHAGRNYYRRELRYGAFLRTLPFETEVKSAEAKATYEEGVLEVRIPKSARAKAAAVRVSVE